jgi:cell division protein FtsQ
MAKTAGKKNSKHQDEGIPRVPIILISGSLLLFAVWGLQRYLGDPKTFPLTSIKVSGEFSNLEKSELERVVARNVDGGFFSTNIQNIRAALMEIPWVAEVHIERKWPQSLEMDVTEKVAFASWGKDALLTRAGEVFRTSRVKGNFDLRLFGPDSEADRVLDYYHVVRPLFTEHGMRVAQMGIDERGEWKVKMRSGIEIMLGTKDELDRLKRYLMAIEKIETTKRQPRLVDLRYEQGFSLYWKTLEGTAKQTGGDT